VVAAETIEAGLRDRKEAPAAAAPRRMERPLE
jgi:hypothetical protein